MSHHEVTVEEINELLDKTEVILASSSSEEKRLVGSLSGMFRVYHMGEPSFSSNVLSGAVKRYNEIGA